MESEFYTSMTEMFMPNMFIPNPNEDKDTSTTEKEHIPCEMGGDAHSGNIKTKNESTEEQGELSEEEVVSRKRQNATIRELDETEKDPAPSRCIIS